MKSPKPMPAISGFAVEVAHSKANAMICCSRGGAYIDSNVRFEVAPEPQVIKPTQIAFTLNHSQRLVQQYLDLDKELQPNQKANHG